MSHVYLLRGQYYIFSSGLGVLARRLRDKGHRATEYSHSSWQKVVDEITSLKQSGDTQPIILIGHSLGANNVLSIAQHLNPRGIKVDLLCTLDAVGEYGTGEPPVVWNNVKHALNFHQPHGLFYYMIGKKLKASPSFTGKLTNIYKPNLSHVTIDKSESIHDRILEEVSWLK